MFPNGNKPDPCLKAPTSARPPYVARSAKSRAVADLPIGARRRVRHHSAMAKQYCPSSSTVARHFSGKAEHFRDYRFSRRLGGCSENRAGRVSVMGRNAFEAPGQQITGRGMADVTQTDHADHPIALVDHRQPADLQRLHVMYRLCEVIVLPATMDAFGHHIARHRAASVEVVTRKAFADDIAVGHHPDQSVVLPNRNAADVMLPHQFREFSDRGVGADPVDTLMHHVFDSHGGPAALEFSGALDAMQHSPRFLDYTTDWVRRHQRLKVAEERNHSTPPVSWLCR